MKFSIFITLLRNLALITTLFASFTVNSADLKLPSYTKVSGISGNISSVGSDTLSNIMTYWAEMFRYEYPSINIQIQASGSSTAPPALTAGISQLAPMSRIMKSSEVEAFERRYGYQPTMIRVAIDALALFVNKDNPIQGITIEQVDAIFSANLKCGAKKSATRWHDLGLTGIWAKQPIQLFGRNSASGTYGYFKSKALCNGDFKSSVNEQLGSASVVQAVASSLNSIGYSGIGYKMSGVKSLPLSVDGNTYVEATKENIVSGSYPLARFLYVYVNKAPNEPLAPAQAEFIRLILSQQGQGIVTNNGYIALPLELVEQELAKLELN